MTVQEAGLCGDISIWYNAHEKEGEIGWNWDVNCGYQSFMSHNTYDTLQEAYDNLLLFIETWEGPTK